MPSTNDRARFAQLAVTPPSGNTDDRLPPGDMTSGTERTVAMHLAAIALGQSLNEVPYALRVDEQSHPDHTSHRLTRHGRPGTTRRSPRATSPPDQALALAASARYHQGASMAIQSASEFEAVLNNVRSRIERELSQRGSVAVLETVIRDLQRIFTVARQSTKLKALRSTLERLTETLTLEIPNDNGLLEQLWDLADFIDYRA
jgi:hypothetical protein